MQLSNDDFQLVCAISGLAFGSDFVGDNDPLCTGRTTTSCDPDIVSGTPVGGWKPRRDVYSDSRRAFEVSHTISGEQAVYKETARELQLRLSRNKPKRGATCVDETREETGKKRLKTQRKWMTHDVADKLTIEATTVIEKLTVFKAPYSSNTNATRQRNGDTSSDSLQAVRPDPRLQSVEFVRGILLAKYIARCKEGTERLDALKVHDVYVCSNEFVRKQRLEARKRETAGLHSFDSGTVKRHVLSGDTKSRIVGLILSLWKACCTSPYLETDVKGADSFRPFCAGILYSLKRGLTIPLLGNIRVIPALPFVSDLLPTLRSPDVTSIARQLQSSSHRGVCTLHRSVASLERLDPGSSEFEKCKQAFCDAAAVSEQLYSFTSALGLDT